MPQPPNTIASLPLAGSGRVDSLGGDLRLRRRLLEMGLCPGTEVRLLRRAPLGDPLVVDVRGYQLSLRAAEARLVHLTAKPSGARAA